MGNGQTQTPAVNRWVTRVPWKLTGGQRGSLKWLVAAALWASWPPLRAVEVVPYDDSWPQLFEAERERLATALGPLALEIVHIGSTAVPGCSAKPTIDVQVMVHVIEPQEPYDKALSRLGYVHFGTGSAHTAAQRFYRPMASRRFHVWIRRRGSTEADAAIRFRDALREDSGIAQEYMKLKVAAAIANPRDREAYSGSKTAFIEAILSGNPQ